MGDADIATLRQALLRYRRSEALLLINATIGVSRERRHLRKLDVGDPARSKRPPDLTFVYYLLAKELLLHGTELGPAIMRPSDLANLADLYFQLGDPISTDPDWPNADPTGFFERYLASQFLTQALNPLRDFGIACRLWATEREGLASLRLALEQALGMPAQTFWQLAFLCSALTTAGVDLHDGQRSRRIDCRGTFTYGRLVDAFAQGAQFCAPESWRPFLRLVAGTPEALAALAREPPYAARDPLYSPFELNILYRRPVVAVTADRHIAVDPSLLVWRCTYGLVYDLADHHGAKSLQLYGHHFERLVGELLDAVPEAEERLWRASEWEARVTGRQRERAGKHVDLVWRGERYNILVECKALRPTAHLTTYGDPASVQARNLRLADALEQAVVHAVAIRSGAWVSERLPDLRCVAIVVTAGLHLTANTPFVRKRVLAELKARACEPIPFVVLAVTELDAMVKLTETGEPLEAVIERIAGQEFMGPAPLGSLYPVLQEHAVSRGTQRAAEDLFEEVERAMAAPTPAAVDGGLERGA